MGRVPTAKLTARVSVMSDYQVPAPKTQPERPQDARSRRDSEREQPRPTPETSRKPRYIFTDFASI